MSIPAENFPIKSTDWVAHSAKACLDSSYGHAKKTFVDFGAAKEKKHQTIE